MATLRRVDLRLERVIAHGDDRIRAIGAAIDRSDGAALSSELTQAYGTLAEVIFLEGPPQAKALLVYESGIAVPAGRDTYLPLLTFGYRGQGPSVFSEFLRASDFLKSDVSEVQVPMRLRRHGETIDGTFAQNTVIWSDGKSLHLPSKPSVEGGVITAIGRCVNCSKHLRAPADRGLLTLTCPACRTRFDWVPPAEPRSVSPALRWERRGSSFEDVARARAQSLSSELASIEVSFDPRDLAVGLLPGSFLTCVFDGTGILVGKVQGSEAHGDSLKRSLESDLVLLRSDVAAFPTFSIVYTRLFIPTAPVIRSHTAALRGVLLENVGNPTNADLQLWAARFEESGITHLRVYDAQNDLVANSEIRKDLGTAGCVARAIDGASQALRAIAPDQQNFREASEAFFAQFPEPFWMRTSEAKRRDEEELERRLLDQIYTVFLGDEGVIERWIAQSLERFPDGSMVERYQYILAAYRRDNA